MIVQSFEKLLVDVYLGPINDVEKSTLFFSAEFDSLMELNKHHLDILRFLNTLKIYCSIEYYFVFHVDDKEYVCNGNTVK